MRTPVPPDQLLPGTDSLFGPLIWAGYRQRWLGLCTVLLVGLGSTGWLWWSWPAPTWQAEAIVVFHPARRTVLTARLESRALARETGHPPLQVIGPPPTQVDGVSRVRATATRAEVAQDAVTRGIEQVLSELAVDVARKEFFRQDEVHARQRRVERELARLPPPADGAIRLPETDRPVFWIVDGKPARSALAAAQEGRLLALLATPVELPESPMTVIDPPGPAILVERAMAWSLEVAWLVSLALGVVVALCWDVIAQTLVQ